MSDENLTSLALALLTIAVILSFIGLTISFTNAIQ